MVPFGVTPARSARARNARGSRLVYWPDWYVVVMNQVRIRTLRAVTKLEEYFSGNAHMYA